MQARLTFETQMLSEFIQSADPPMPRQLNHTLLCRVKRWMHATSAGFTRTALRSFLEDPSQVFILEVRVFFPFETGIT